MSSFQAKHWKLGLLAALLAGCGPTAKPAIHSDTAPSEADRKAELEAAEAQVEAKQIAAITGAINEFGPAVHTCWSRAAAQDFHVEGTVVLGITVLEKGGSDVVLLKNDSQNAVLSECLLNLWSEARWPEVFSPGDAIQLPPFAFIAPEQQYVVASPHVDSHSFADGKITAKVVLDAQNTGNPEAALTLLRLKEGAVVPMHTHTSAELLVVMAGAGKVVGAGGTFGVAAHSTIYIPAGVPHSFVHTGAAPIELIQLYAAGGPEQRFKDPTKTAGTTAFVGKIPRRGKKIRVYNNRATRLFTLGGRGATFTQTMFREEGDVALMGVLKVSASGAIASYRNSSASEFFFVLEGEAVLTLSGRNFHIGPGDAVQIPNGVLHSLTIAGNDAFKAVQFYAPASSGLRFEGEIHE